MELQHQSELLIPHAWIRFYKQINYRTCGLNKLHGIYLCLYNQLFALFTMFLSF